MYPSAPFLLRLWTAGAFPDYRVVTETPAKLQSVIASRTAVIRIQRVGGPRSITLDRPTIDVDVFAASLEVADRVCGLVCDAWEFTMPGATIDAGENGKAVVARTAITSGPQERPVTDPTLSRVGASAALVLHAR